MKDNVSICLDSDIGYHHHFKIGDVLLIIMDDDLGIKLKHDWIEVINPSFTLDWDKTCSARLSTASCINKGVMVYSPDLFCGHMRNRTSPYRLSAVLHIA